MADTQSLDSKQQAGFLPSDAAVHVFGVRHLSPMGALQLRRFLDQVQPELVLVEGLSDANGLIKDIARKKTKPPIAILAYTQSTPVRTLVYPMANYSPEYQAVLWGQENKTRVDFFDLPSDIFLALQAKQDERWQQSMQQEQTDDDPDADQTDDPETEVPEIVAEPPEPGEGLMRERVSLYQQIAEQAGEADYDTYWERSFEHNASPFSYRQCAYELGVGIRELETRRPDWPENLIREAYMRRKIAEAIDSGIPANKIVAVVGAFHWAGLLADQPAMTDVELQQLQRLPSNLTLMPYSYFRLSSQSGYGAGNQAPAYFELLWQAISEDRLDELPSRYVTAITRKLREQGTHRSTASVIEAVRLAKTLSAMRNGLSATLSDLHDAVTTLIGYGERSTVAEAIAYVDVGTAIGQLPKGVSQTSIQLDFDQQLERLKLTKYRDSVKQDLMLDLRENRQAKTTAAAFLDLQRSSFLHRLKLLGIQFATSQRHKQASATWAESWALQWTPESEIQLVESVLMGETIELATGFKFKSDIDACVSVDNAAQLVRIACQCGMMSSMELARAKLQQLANDSNEFVAVAGAASELSLVVRFGDVRNYDAAALVPLIEELFVQGCTSLFEAANCDNPTAANMIVAIDQLNKVGQEHFETVDEELWRAQLAKLSDADDRNPLLSGYACAILLEDNLISNEDLAREVSRRLSPGISADLGAGWFEGMASRNRYALLARQALWEQLSQYVQSLDEEQFRRALVFLRRAFGSFSPQEKTAICENLGQHWGLNEDAVSEAIAEPLTEQENEALDELGDFDFEDF